MDESTFHVTEGLQSWQLANHAARGGGANEKGAESEGYG